MQLGKICHNGRDYDPEPDDQHVMAMVQLTSLGRPHIDWGVIINLPVELAASPIFIEEFQDALANMHETAVLALEGK